MHGVSFRTVEWLYLPVHLCLIHRLHSIPTTLQVSFFGTSQGNSLSHLVLYCTKCFELSSMPTFLFLAFFHNFNLLLLLVSNPRLPESPQSPSAWHLHPLLPESQQFPLACHLHLPFPESQLSLALLTDPLPESLFPLCSLLHCSPHPLCHLLP